jgi:hypothetical protein
MIDNLQVNVTYDVPQPAALLLLLSGGPALKWRRAW